MQIKISEMCQLAGVEMSSVQYQEKEELCKWLEIEGFMSLMSSESLIKNELQAKAI